MWELIFNILKVIGAVCAIVAAVVVIARVWNGTARERLIDVLKAELKVARDHCTQCDQDVRHYRDEMHAVRGKCEAEISTGRLKIEESQDALKAVQIQNAELRAKTDLTPVMKVMTDFITEQRKFVKEQTEINQKVLAALTKLAG